MIYLKIKIRSAWTGGKEKLKERLDEKEKFYKIIY